MADDYQRRAAQLMSMPPAERVGVLKHYKENTEPHEFAQFKREVIEGAKQLRAMGARPVDVAPFAPHERRNIQRTARAVTRAAQHGNPAARTMTEIAVNAP